MAPLHSEATVLIRRTGELLADEEGKPYEHRMGPPVAVLIFLHCMHAYREDVMQLVASAFGALQAFNKIPQCYKSLDARLAWEEATKKGLYPCPDLHEEVLLFLLEKAT